MQRALWAPDAVTAWFATKAWHSEWRGNLADAPNSCLSQGSVQASTSQTSAMAPSALENTTSSPADSESLLRPNVLIAYKKSFPNEFQALAVVD